MAIQIFGTSKSFDTQKAERWFAERRIQVQVVNLKQKPMSKGEFDSVVSAIAKRNGCSKDEAIEQLIDTKSKYYASIKYLDESQKAEKLLENPQMMKQPVVRNGKTDATVGICPDIWKTWS